MLCFVLFNYHLALEEAKTLALELTNHFSVLNGIVVQASVHLLIIAHSLSACWVQETDLY